MEDVVTLEIAKRLNDIGYPQYNSYKSYFIGDGEKRYMEIESLINRSKRAEDFHLIAAPTVSQVMKWLRNEKNIVFGITPIQENDGDYVCWCITIYTIVDYGYGLIFEEELHCYSYEEAAMTGIKYSLDNLI